MEKMSSNIHDNFFFDISETKHCLEIISKCLMMSLSFCRDGTALAGVNFRATLGVAVFEHGEDTATVKVPLLSHPSSTSSPTFTVRLELNPTVCRHRLHTPTLQSNSWIALF
jgi:hypothetical protein